MRKFFMVCSVGATLAVARFVPVQCGQGGLGQAQSLHHHNSFTKCTKRSTSSYPIFKCAAMLPSFSSHVSDAISVQPFSRAHSSATHTISLPSFCPRR